MINERLAIVAVLGALCDEKISGAEAALQY